MFPPTTIQPVNLNMTTFDPEVEHILNVILAAKSKTNNVRQMVVTNDLLDYKSFKQLDTEYFTP